MTMYALIQTSTSDIKEVVDGNKRFRSGNPPTLNPAKDLHWLPFTKVQPTYDSKTQVRTGPVEEVTAKEVTQTWTVRDKTAQEIDADVDDQAAAGVRTLKPLIMALNDGTFVLGQNYSNAQMKAIIKAHL